MTTETQEADPTAAHADPSGPIPDLRSPLSPDDAIARLSKLSKKGKLAGFERQDGAPAGSHHFSAAVFGQPYDRVLLARITPDPDMGSGCVVTGECVLPRKLPTIMVVVMILTIWPGAWLTHSMLALYFGWYPNALWVTLAWYLPLTILAIPALLRQFKRSEALAAHELATLVQTLARALDADVVCPNDRAD
ncbi:MAG: hypothetical protein AAGD00_03405 [Planctomycetota bacterium]